MTASAPTKGAPISPKRRALEIASTLAAASGLTRLARRPWQGPRARRAVLLAYHDVGAEESEGCIHPERLRRHIRHLKKSYALCTVSEAAEALAAPGGLERDLAVLTFDDGYAGNYHAAWPVLREEGVSATIYLTTGFLDGQPLWFDVARCAYGGPARKEAETLLRDTLRGWQPTLGIEAALEIMKRLSADARRELVDALLPMTADPGKGAVRGRAPAQPLRWSEAAELAASGIELGGHTVTHPILSALTPDEQHQELLDSAMRIREAAGAAPRSFAIPNGSRDDFDAATLEAARAAGFDSVCTMIRGSNAAGANPMQLRRIGVGADSEAVLEARLCGLVDWFRRNPAL